MRVAQHTLTGKVWHHHSRKESSISIDMWVKIVSQIPVAETDSNITYDSVSYTLTRRYPGPNLIFRFKTMLYWTGMLFPCLVQQTSVISFEKCLISGCFDLWYRMVFTCLSTCTKYLHQILFHHGEIYSNIENLWRKMQRPEVDSHLASRIWLYKLVPSSILYQKRTYWAKGRGTECSVIMKCWYFTFTRTNQAHFQHH